MGFVAAILAGGESKRFGADKALAQLAGRPMLAHVARALGGAGALAVVGASETLIIHAEAAGASAAHACTGDGVHALCAAWRPALAARLRGCFAAGVHPPVREFAPDAVRVAFPDAALINVNTPQDLARALVQLGGA
jgi:molybdopterin-guanine dinucleotide biosynthesis protein A